TLGRYVVGDEPAEGSAVSGGSEKPWFAKIFVKDARGFTMVDIEAEPYRTYAEIPTDKILDTRDVARRSVCKPATVIRHVGEGNVKIHAKASSSHDFYYVKQDVEEWLKGNPTFKPGRRPKRRE